MTTTVGMRTLKARHSWPPVAVCLVLGALAADFHGPLLDRLEAAKA